MDRTPGRLLTTDKPRWRHPTLSGWQRAAVVLVLGLQLVLPLRFYLGGRGDDERLASPVATSIRLDSCTVEVLERDQTERFVPVVLAKELHPEWISLLERNRPQVVEAYLIERCKAEPAPLEVHFVNRCTGVAAESLPPTLLGIDCESRAVRTLEYVP